MWEAALSVCYKVHRRMKTALDAKAQCSFDHPRSKILRADSEVMYDFLLHTIGIVD